MEMGSYACIIAGNGGFVNVHRFTGHTLGRPAECIPDRRRIDNSMLEDRRPNRRDAWWFVGYILIFVAGLAISEYYNRRIQRIITRQTVRRPAPPRRQASGPYTQADMELMRDGYRVGHKTGGNMRED